MRKINKILISIFGVFLAAGLIFTIVGLCLGGADDFTFWWNRDKNAGGTEKTKTTATKRQTVENSEAVSRISIDFGAGELIIRHGDYDEIAVVSEGLASSPKLKTETGELRVQYHGRMLTGGCVYLELPKELLLEKMAIEAGAGSVQIDYLKADEIDINIGAGELVCEGKMEADKLECEVGMGDVQIAEADLIDMEVEVGMGNFEIVMEKREKDYFFTGEVAMGDLVYGRQSWSFNDEITAGELDAERVINAECSMGSLEIHFKK